MKSFFFALAIVLSSAAQASEAEFVTSCTVALTGMASTAKLTVSSPAFEMDRLPGNSQARVEFGGHTVFAQVAMMAESGSNEYEPTLMMQFFRGADPVQGNISLLFARGMEFNNWEIGRTQSIRSFAFGQVLHEGASYVRTDYSCKVTRVK